MIDCVLVDFDGTLTTQDTTRYLVLELLALRPWRLAGVVARVAGMCLARKGEAFQSAKYRLIGYLLKGLTAPQLINAVSRFSERVNRFRRTQVIEAIEARKQSGAIVLVVSASPDFAVRGALSDLSVEVIGTSFELKGDRYTGNINGRGCFGLNKPAYIDRWMEERELKLNFVEGWGDDLSDLSMMQLTSERYWICNSFKETDVQRLDPAGRIIANGKCRSRDARKGCIS